MSNYEALRSDLSRIRWVDLLESCGGVNEKYELLLAVLHTAIDYYVPWEKVTSFKSTPLPRYLRNMSEYRDCLFQETRRAGNWSRYNEFTGVFLTRLSKYLNNIEKKVVESGNLNFYRYLNRKLHDKGCIGPLKCGDLMACSPNDKANMFADQFSKSFSSEDVNVPHFSPTSDSTMNQLPWFYADQLYKRIMSWPNSSSVTPDFIPLFFIQKIADVICGPLSYIFNQSLMKGEVPARWRHSFVTPALKKEPSCDPANYRPVSITSLFCRLFEKTIKEHILEYAAVNRIIPRVQHGFVPGRSVETNMIESLEDWTAVLDNGRRCDVIYFDFAKAFDRVPHRRLLHKLEMLGFHPTLVSWISDFLHGRTFQVRVGQSFFESRRVLSGVPQGGVLSPVLFNIYTAEIPFLFDGLDVTTKMYADDVKIYKVITEAKDQERLQTAIDILSDWAKRWQLPLAPQKTKCMTIDMKSEIPSSLYTVEGVTITNVTSVRDLSLY
ncbi:hypothetical protein V3C99_005461 [Haemonchus contortus]